ncbi:hypothetical protein Tco_0265575 [Tanacetum coccineum]
MDKNSNYGSSLAKTDDEVLQGKEQVNDDEDEEMTNAEVEDSRKGDAKISNVAKVDVEKTGEAKDDSKKAELPPTSSSLSVSSGFGDQFLKLSSDTSLTGTVKDTIDVEISSPYTRTRNSFSSTYKNSTSPSVSIIPLVPLQQTTAPIPTTPITADAPTITTAIPKSDALFVVQLRVTKLEKDVFELKKIYYFARALATLKSQVLTVFEQYLGSKIGDDLQKVLQRHIANLIQKYSVKPAPESIADIVNYHKRKHNDDDDDDNEDPPAGPNQGKKTKRIRTKELESSKKPSSTKETPKGKAPSKGSKTGKSASAKEPVEEPITEVVMDGVGEDVNNLEGDRYPFDLSKPLPLQGHPGHLTVVVDYFFNNDLEYLKSSDPERTYTTSIIKIKEAQYEIIGIEYMKILGVYSVSVKKLHGYGHLEEVVVKRADRQVYKFKEDDFMDLHLNDIEDMLILAVQHKLFHLNDSDIVDFIVALHMFTRSLVIKRRVKDLQLSVESYQKKLNISAPQQTFPEIKFKERYTPSYKPPGVIYEDLTKQKRVMRADEVYKFSDGTHKKVRDGLHYKILDFAFRIQQGDVKEKVDGHRQKEIRAFD